VFGLQQPDNEHRLLRGLLPCVEGTTGTRTAALHGLRRGDRAGASPSCPGVL